LSPKPTTVPDGDVIFIPPPIIGETAETVSVDIENQDNSTVSTNTTRRPVSQTAKNNIVTNPIFAPIDTNNTVNQTNVLTSNSTKPETDKIVIEVEKVTVIEVIQEAEPVNTGLAAGVSIGVIVALSLLIPLIIFLVVPKMCPGTPIAKKVADLKAYFERI
jgi:hypothetical protein